MRLLLDSEGVHTAISTCPGAEAGTGRVHTHILEGEMNEGAFRLSQSGVHSATQSPDGSPALLPPPLALPLIPQLGVSRSPVLPTIPNAS